MLKSKLKKSFALLATAYVAVFYSFLVYGVRAGDRPPSVMHNVPFSRQAPLGEWDDPRQVDGCEETSLLMAMAWVRGGSVPPEEARRDIINISEYERVIFGFYQDTSIADTARLLREFYNHQNYTVLENIGSDSIKDELAAGRLAVIALNTRLTGLPIYRYGPTRHTVVAVGYDDYADEIIVHDPYYGSGQYLRIPSRSLNNALWDYRSGVHLSHGPKRSAMISIGR